MILASRSTVRLQILEAAGLPVEVQPAAVDERALEQALTPHPPAKRIAHLLARAKAEDVAARHPDRVIVAADQTLARDARLYTKPVNRDSAKEQLTSLAGRTHKLHSAIAVHIAGRLAFEHVETARMTMRPLSGEFLERYLEAAGPAVQTSVGGYQLEGLGVHLFAAIEGDYFTILGLPLLPLLDFLRREGLVEK